ncbi:MAG TPA: VOC family protein [Candidatus Nanopelagicales bacterium]|nr:VOC family protein [Candidatus Nanopelagicales bacterium]
MRLDHLSYACTTSEIADVVQRIGSDLGGTFIDGGRHPSFGTRNFILPLAGGAYVEVVSALDHPAALKAPFGQAVHRRAEDGGGWLSWVLAVDDIAPIEQRLGREAARGRRIRPDGVELCWKQIGILDTMDTPHVPFFVTWDCADTEHPSAGGSGSAISIAAIELAGDRQPIASLLDTDTAINGVELRWVEDEPGVSAVIFATPAGNVRID